MVEQTNVFLSEKGKLNYESRGPELPETIVKLMVSQPHSSLERVNIKGSRAVGQELLFYCMVSRMFYSVSCSNLDIENGHLYNGY